MKPPKGIVVVILLLGFSMLQVASARFTPQYLADCGDNEYLAGTVCRECPPCPAGEQSTLHCGYKQTANRLRKTGASCEKCPPGTYKEGSVGMCEDCDPGCPKGKTPILQCNSTSNIKCTDCPLGYFEYGLNKDCVKCSPCCGDPTVFNANEHLIRKCEKDGMGHCSCRPLICEIPTKTACPTLRPPVRNTNTRQTTTHWVTRQRTVKVRETTTPHTPRQTSRPRQLVAMQDNLHKDEEERADTKELRVSVWIVVPIAALLLLLGGSMITMVFQRRKVCKRLPLQEDHLDVSRSKAIEFEDFQEFKAEPTVMNMAQRINPGKDETLAQASLSDSVQNSTSQDDDTTTSSINSATEFSSAYRIEVLSSDDGYYATHAQDFSLSPTWIRRSAESILNRTNNNTDVDGSVRADPLQSNMDHHQHPIRDAEENSENQSLRSHFSEQGGESTVKGEKKVNDTQGKMSIPVTAKTADGTVVIATGLNQEKKNEAAPQETQATKLKCTCPKRPTSDKNKEDKTRTKETSKSPLPDMKPRFKPCTAEILRCTCGDCVYRPFDRNSVAQACNCSRCSPHPSDDLFKVIERNCLHKKICKELNKTGIANWCDVMSYMRKDAMIPDIDAHNPAADVLQRLRAHRPNLKLGEFTEILEKIGRRDVIHEIENHHRTCHLCIRNSFDFTYVSYS
ncbi:predicted protein [Nematostella vectensis]|uniref:TNFR-Cys domain-containing protein n=1 Tax=Nematostella vectensis TaxID=45351 RepID=A7RFS9_NEMVE|nr:predicted protein [Nematostella vectensis]|eukprot:XP_001641837.1 predicted protein [Nematostella vectensis]